jgi:hypothetical protein
MYAYVCTCKINTPWSTYTYVYAHVYMYRMCFLQTQTTPIKKLGTVRTLYLSFYQ